MKYAIPMAIAMLGLDDMRHAEATQRAELWQAFDDCFVTDTRAHADIQEMLELLDQPR